MSDSTYCGETVGKKLTRYEVYRRLWHAIYTRTVGDEAWFDTGPYFSPAVILCGPEAAEARVIRGFNNPGFPLTGIIAVDRVAEGLDLAESLGCGAFHGEVAHLLSRAPACSLELVSLDLMGTLGPDTVDLALLAASRVRHGGGMIVTFLRGRDPESGRSGAFQAHHARRTVLQPKAPVSARRRNRSSLDRTSQRALAAARLAVTIGQPVVLIRYRSNKSPMATMAIRVLHDGAKKRRVANTGFVARIEQTERHLRNAALLLADRSSGKEAADMLNIDQRTIAAWRAHRTRGTYPEAPRA